MKTKNLVAAVAVGVLALTPMHVYAEKTQVAHTDEKTFTSIDDAWQAAKGTTVYLDSDWNLDSRLVLDSDESATLELNGHTISRGLTSSKRNGEVFKLCGGSNLTLTGNGAKSDIAFKAYDQKGKTYDEVLTAGGMITGGYSTNGGGGIHMKSGATLNIDGVDICGNNSEQSLGSDGHGGAIYVDGDDNVLNINNSYIGYNYAEENGGAIYVDDNDSTVNLTNTTVGFNTSGENCGGAVYIRKFRNKLNMTDSTLTNNYAHDKGGAVYMADNAQGGEVVMKNSHVSYNEAGNSDGGAFYINDYKIDVWVYGGSIDHNTAKGSGGAFYMNDKKDNVFLEEGASVNDNTAKEGNGGAIYFNYSFGYVISHTTDTSTIANNKAPSGRGGAIYAARNSSFNQEMGLRKINFVGNEADQGGALDIHSEGVNIISCNFTENKARIASAIFVNNDDLRLGWSSVTGNTTTDSSSGAVHTSALNDITIYGCDVTIRDNYNEGTQTYRNLVLGESLTCDSYILGADSGDRSGKIDIGVSVGSERKICKNVLAEGFFSDTYGYTVNYTSNDDGTKNAKVMKATQILEGAQASEETTDEAATESSESTESTEQSSEAASTEQSAELVESTQHIVTINLEDNAGWTDSDQISYVESDEAKVSPPVIDGKTFKEWKNLPEGATVEDDNTVNLGKLKEDVEITCVFTADETEDSNATGSVFGSGNSTTVIVAIVVACICGAGGFFAGKKSGKKE